MCLTLWGVVAVFCGFYTFHFMQLYIVLNILEFLLKPVIL